ncbi:hypothetical protein EDB81DRAFT_663942 [Dactylonectria macrodidyma]|uniref:LysM domain-containing protein n=1 Tax=Dactylonectria macrodidyma TaxID=307937 RepID=A0A9P9DSJ8_9HYPO|nr:hypothetical protein EDB81DRAFT_663942 [Dactylonectria macrodidyma]
MINDQKRNITALEGQGICISNPEGDYAIPSNSEGSPTIATTTAAIPDPTPDSTEDECGEYHLVTAGEDCGTFTIKYGITLDDFICLNPHVWENCTNVYLGYYYCVRPVGYISTYPGYLPTTSTEKFVATGMTAAPDDYDIDWLDRSAEVTIPLAKDTRKDCETYLYVTNIMDTPLIADCWSMAMVCGITSEDIVLWSPSLAQSGSNASDHTYNYPCTLSESVSYCVALEEATEAAQADEAPPSPRAVGEIENCTAWYNPESYETCENVLDTNWLDFDDFYAMNPSVSSDCSGLVVGTYYCISTIADGSPPSDDDEVVTTATGVSSTAAATATGVTTPSSVQSGMVSGCAHGLLGTAGQCVCVYWGVEMHQGKEKGRT